MSTALLEVKQETVAQVWDEMQCLLAEHWHEIACNKDVIPLAPDRGRYELLEREGKLLTLACRADGVLAGYAVFFVNTHIHYSTTLIATNDVLFVTHCMRASRAGYLLIRESERALREMGVIKLVWHVKPSLDWSMLLKHRDYGLIENVYGKML